MEDLFGYEPEEPEGSPLLSLMPEELRPAHRSAPRRYPETDERTMDWGACRPGDPPGRQRPGGA